MNSRRVAPTSAVTGEHHPPAPVRLDEHRVRSVNLLRSERGALPPDWMRSHISDDALAALIHAKLLSVFPVPS